MSISAHRHNTATQTKIKIGKGSLRLVAVGLGALLTAGLGIVGLEMRLIPIDVLTPPLAYLTVGLLGLLLAYSIAMTALALLRQRAPSSGIHSGPLLGLLAAVELRDPHTRQHSQKVATQAVAIARQLGLDEKAVARVREAALLCDLGMAFLPDAIRAHRGSLEASQRAVVMTHPLLAYQVLKRCGAPEYLALAARHHHERYGGTGYPDALSESQIPIEAQIIGVADSYVSMTSERPHRRALSPEAAIQELQMGRGTLFNPNIVDAFLKEMGSTQPEDMAPPQGWLVEMADPPPWTLGMVSSSQHKASTILFRLGQEAKSTMDLPMLLGRTLALLQEVLGYHHCAIFLKQDDEGCLVLRAASGGRRHQEGMRIAKGQGLIGWVAQYGVVRLVPDVTSDPAYAADSFFGAGSMLVAPLTVEWRGTGVLIVESEDSDGLAVEDARLVETIGPHIAALIEVARLHQQATEAAYRDYLTGLYNQRYFYERFDEELARSKRHNLSLSIAILDIDGLKAVNDTYGHLAGDQTLKKVSSILQDTLRASDVVARYGGDEFAIIMPQTETEEAEKVIARMMVALDTEMIAQNGTIFPIPTISCGIAAFPRDGDQSTDIFGVADSRLYLAKKHKRNPSRGPVRTVPEGTAS